MTKPSASVAQQLDEQRRKVDFDTYDITVEQLISMTERRAIDIAPTYQRQFRWDARRRSQLIESIFLGIPVPSLFMASNPDGTWELVDGVQRLSTLVAFAGESTARKKLALDKLRLSDLEKLTEFNGKTLADLPDSLQLQFRLRPIKVVTLSDKSDSVVRFDLFERLNTGGIALTDQEIRSCIFRGPFAEFLEKLATFTPFRNVVRLPDKRETDGTREEYVLRFFAFLNEHESFEHSVVGFLNDFMKRASQSFDYRDGERVFKDTFTQLARLLPSGLTRRQKTTPVNLYEAVAVGAGLIVQKKKKLKKASMAWVKSADLQALTTGATNNRQKVIDRIQYCQKQFS